MSRQRRDQVGTKTHKEFGLTTWKWRVTDLQEVTPELRRTVVGMHIGGEQNWGAADMGLWTYSRQGYCVSVNFFLYIF